MRLLLFSALLAFGQDEAQLCDEEDEADGTDARAESSCPHEFGVRPPLDEAEDKTDEEERASYPAAEARRDHVLIVPLRSGEDADRLASKTVVVINTATKCGQCFHLCSGVVLCLWEVGEDDRNGRFWEINRLKIGEKHGKLAWRHALIPALRSGFRVEEWKDAHEGSV